MLGNSKPGRAYPSGWISRFGSAPDLPPDSAWEREQIEGDNRMIELMAQGLLLHRDSQTGKHVKAERVWAISRTTISKEMMPLLPGCAEGNALLGGWVTLQEALIEYPQPEVTDSAEQLMAA